MKNDKTQIIQIIETSDVHGHFFPYDFVNHCEVSGSLARVHTFAEQMRDRYGAENVFLLDNGDLLQGQPICYYYHHVASSDSHIAAQCTNYLRYDAQTLGNHDIETGHAIYDKWIKQSHAPILGANIIDTKTGRPYVPPYCVLCKDGEIKIAIVGLTTPTVPCWLKKDLWSGLRFEDMVTTARQVIQDVKQRERPDVIVGLFHSGWDGGVKLQGCRENAVRMVAEQVPGFDVLFFGHDHIPRQLVVKNSEGKEVLCLNPGHSAHNVALATLKMTYEGGRWSLTQKQGRVVNLSNLLPDAAYMHHFSGTISRVKAWADQPLGIFLHGMGSLDSLFGSSAFNDFILNNKLQVTHADVAFNAPLSLQSVFKAGQVTVADLFDLYRYEDKIYVMRLTGEEIRRHLEMSYDLWVNTMRSPNDHLLHLSRVDNGSRHIQLTHPFFNFDSAAGIDYEVDVTRPDGEKVKILRMSDGKPFSLNSWYNVAINSYRGSGGGELLTKGAGIAHNLLPARIVWEGELDQRSYLMQEIKRRGTLDPKPNNNWRFVPEDWTGPAADRDRRLLLGK